ncbi:MAG: DUF4258 domain-containing protein [Planctomycetota bacterium]|nr:hypothetical protein [Planctomycetaceae bacterium]MDQ3330051.1 DUF4258 domain-containing protein [Planctomycetota bacterium]
MVGRSFATWEFLFANVKAAVAEDRYLVGLHAYERMTQRGILEWQVVAGLEHG